MKHLYPRLSAKRLLTMDPGLRLPRARDVFRQKPYAYVTQVIVGAAFHIRSWPMLYFLRGAPIMPHVLHIRNAVHRRVLDGK